MIEFERLKEIVKAELGWVLIDKGDYYDTRNDRLYIKKYRSDLYVALRHYRVSKDNVETTLELNKIRVKAENELISLFRKYKKLKKALR